MALDWGNVWDTTKDVWNFATGLGKSQSKGGGGNFWGSDRNLLEFIWNPDEAGGGISGLNLQGVFQDPGRYLGTAAGVAGTYAGYQATDPNAYNQEYLDSLNQQLNPLRESSEKLGEMAGQYQDPNSAINQQIRGDIRTQNMEGMRNLLRRNQAASTGLSRYGQDQVSQNTMSDAIGKALQAHSRGLADSYKTGADMYGQQANINNALAQAQLQNRMLAGQAEAQRNQFLAQTGYGLAGMEQ